MSRPVAGLGRILVAGAVVLAASGVLVARRAFAVITVVGPSMEPTLPNGVRVLVRIGGRSWRVGDTVVCEQPDTPRGRARWSDRPRTRRVQDTDWIVKRVAALGGDPVPEVATATVDGATVPPATAVLLGDNADNSYDSRTAGAFPTERIRGRVLRMLGR